MSDRVSDAWERAGAIRKLLAQEAGGRRVGGRPMDGAAEADLRGGLTVRVRDESLRRLLQATIDDVVERLEPRGDQPSKTRRFAVEIELGDPMDSGWPGVCEVPGIPGDCGDSGDSGGNIVSGPDRRFRGAQLQACSGEASGGEFEGYRLVVESGRCRITARDSAGCRRALYAVLDEVERRAEAGIALGERRGWTTLRRRITRSPIAAYRFKSGWELLDEHDYYPDAYLRQLARMGVNGIWAAGLFRTLLSSGVFPEAGPAACRLDKLKELVKRAGRYGIEVYLFCMEPRSVKPRHRIWHDRPQVLGAWVDEDERCLCTSHEQVRAYLTDAVTTLFKEVAGLAGLISIFNGERITNCWLSEAYARTCPRCAERPQAQVLAEYLGCMAEGIRQAGSEARCLAWAYWMDPDDELRANRVQPLLDVIERSDRDIVWLANFEHGGEKMLGDQRISIDEYSLSYAGPSGHFREVAELCGRQGRPVHAKLQIGSPFEISSLPYVPVPGLVFEKAAGMKSLGVSGAMLNWIPGGFVSPMLDAVVRAASFTGEKRDFLRQLASRYWPDSCVASVVEAWGEFERAFEQYPFNNRFFYFGPITRGPAYPLRLNPEPSQAFPLNWGINRLRERQPYEESLERWLGPFTVEQVMHQLELMLVGWSRGLAWLDGAVTTANSPAGDEQWAVADAVRCHLQAALNVIRFIVNRRELDDSPEDPSGRIESLRAAARSQIELAQAMLRHIAVVASIGYQSEILDFSYDEPMLREAIEACRLTLAQLDEPIDAIRQHLRRPRPLSAVNAGIPDLEKFGD